MGHWETHGQGFGKSFLPQEELGGSWAPWAHLSLNDLGILKDGRRAQVAIEPGHPHPATSLQGKDKSMNRGFGIFLLANFTLEISLKEKIKIIQRLIFI